MRLILSIAIEWVRDLHNLKINNRGELTYIALAEAAYPRFI